MPIDILREAEADLAELAGLPGAIRNRVKAGVAELQRLRDAIDAEIARLTGDAKATLKSLQAPAATEPDTPPSVADPIPSTPPADIDKPALAF